MAAPKKWGYSREAAIADEILVAWSDGDLIEILVKEVEERLLVHRDEREAAAAWARTVEASRQPLDGGRDWLEECPPSLVKRCVAMVDEPGIEPAQVAPGISGGGLGLDQINPGSIMLTFMALSVIVLLLLAMAQYL